MQQALYLDKTGQQTIETLTRRIMNLGKYFSHVTEGHTDNETDLQQLHCLSHNCYVSKSLIY